MTLLKQLLTEQYSEPLILSKIFYTTQSCNAKNQQLSNQKFIPFLNERDRMNRLIKQSLINLNKKHHKRGQTISQNISKAQSIELSLVKSKQLFFHNPQSNINMNFFHQKTHLFNLNKPQSKIRRKNTISVKHEYPIQKTQHSLHKSRSVPKKLTFNISSASSPQKYHKQLPMKKYKSSLSEKKIKPVSSNQRAKSSISRRSNRQINSNVQKSQEQQQRQSYPQLARFKQMKKLSVKVIDDFQSGHNTFIEKIKAAKRDAIKMIQQNII